MYLPDPSSGYYRGPRFDWSGIMASLRLDGHEVFGEWKDGPRDPLGNDFVVGPAGEFGMGPDTGNPSPIGYDDAPVGGTFLKIGAGGAAEDRRRAVPFRPCLPAGERAAVAGTVGRVVDGVPRGGLDRRGLGLPVPKRIEIDDTGPAMTIRYALENTGARGFRQTWYSHNFIRVDDQPIGTGYRLEFPFAPRLARTVGEAVEVRGNAHRVSARPRAGRGHVRGGGGVRAGPGAPRGHRPRSDARPCASRGTRRCTSCTCSPPGARCAPSCSWTSICAPGALRTWTNRYSLEA